MQKVASNKSFGGEQLRYEHDSEVLHCKMKFSIYLPPNVSATDKQQRIPFLVWLSGLTCTDENFVQKAGAQRLASQLGCAIVAPDTSPRGEGVADAPDAAYDLGLGAGFYVNATQKPWQAHYQMYSYIVEELPALLFAHFPLDMNRQSIAGHSMGGHGALVIALRNPQKYRSVSAFAPICAPSQCSWGEKALTAYLGTDRSNWLDYDATALLARAGTPIPTLIDQGKDDQFLAEQLRPELFLAEAKRCNWPVQYQARDGYDHSYFFIASFIDEHLRFHHAAWS